MSRAERKAETRARLIAVAREAFQHQGFEEVTFRELARAAKVSTGAFFGHFVDKSALFEAATGLPAPDPVAFLERVAVVCAGRGPELQNLAEDAVHLRRQLIGR